MSTPQLGVEVVQRMVDDLKNVGMPDAKITLSGRNIFVLLTPLAAAKRVLVWGKKEDELDDEVEA